MNPDFSTLESDELFQVKILGTCFDVTKESFEDDTAGSSCDSEREIKIEKLLPETARNETYWHEVIHMMLSLSGVSHSLHPAQKEAVCQCIGHGLHRYFEDNKKEK